MYKVLLVDDEPLVLAGIKIMIDWEKNGCELAGNARNGQQALESIEELQPDIVIADINMPVMDGVQLLRRASEQYPEIVFLMLTNLQQFELARESLRYKAVDYLVKSQLDPEVLEKGLSKAKEESDKRQSLTRVDIVDTYLRSGKNHLLRESVMTFIASPIVPPETADFLKKAGVLDGYMLVEIQFLHYKKSATVSGEVKDDPQSLQQIYLWERELVEELAKGCFENFLSTDLDIPQQSIYLMIWGEDDFVAASHSFHKKLMAASSNITRVQPTFLATDRLSGPESLPECRRQLFALRDSFYLSGEYVLYYSTMPGYEYRTLALSGIADNLKEELRRRSTGGTVALFDKAIAAVRDVPHEKSQALWLCTELYSAVDSILKSAPSGMREGSSFDESAFLQLRYLATRNDVLEYLEALKNEVISIQQSLTGRSSDIVEKAMQYVYDNIEKRIMLQDAAQHACISPGYLSAVFKKQHGENFVDFINRTKMNRACELIAKGEYRISQIGYMLSYENAYYFTRVFKRYTGMTPSEYQEKLRREQQEKNTPDASGNEKPEDGAE